MVTKKKYVETVVPLLQEKAKPILAGHKLPPAILTMLQTRPDVCAQLAVFGYLTINWKKGHGALKKNDQFKITGYKNFPDFAKNSPSDIAKFQETLPAKDKKDFQAYENVVAIMIVPDVATGDLDNDIVNLKSKILTYGKALDKQYAGMGAIVITVAFGSSYFLPKNAVRAEKTEKINKRNSLRMTPAKVKQELAKKNKEKLAFLKEQGAEYKTEKERIEAQLSQLGVMKDEFGNSAKEYDANLKKDIKAELETLSPEQKKMYNDIEKYRKAGKHAIADAIKVDFDASIVAKGGSTILVDKPKTANEILSERQEEYKKNIEKLEANVLVIQEKINNAPNAQVRRNLNWTLRQNQAKIEDLKSKLGIHGSANKIEAVIANKKLALEKINAQMEANFAEGMTLKNAMNKAVATSNIDPKIVAEISADLKAEVANGMTQEEAIAHVISDDVVLPTTPNSRYKVNDGTAFVGRKVYKVNTKLEEGELYSYTETIFDENSSSELDVEFFTYEKNAIEFVNAMNDTLIEKPVEDAYDPNKEYVVNDGVIKERESLYYVETNIPEGTKYERLYDPSFVYDPETTREYFVDEQNAIDFVDKMNATLPYVPAEYPINNGGTIKEGESGWYVDTSAEIFKAEFDPAFIYDENTTREYFPNQDEAMEWADEMNKAKIDEAEIQNFVATSPLFKDEEKPIYTINNEAQVREGDALWYVETNIAEGETYKREFDPAFIYDENTTREYFLTDGEASYFANEMNATLVQPTIEQQLPSQEFDVVGVDGNFSYGDTAYYVHPVDYIDGYPVYGYETIQVQGNIITSRGIKTDEELFVSEENAKLYVDVLVESDPKSTKAEPIADETVNETFEVNDGSANIGQELFAVDIAEGDEFYSVYPRVFNNNVSEADTEFFISEENAKNYADSMNATLTPKENGNSPDDIADILSFL